MNYIIHVKRVQKLFWEPDFCEKNRNSRKIILHHIFFHASDKFLFMLLRAETRRLKSRRVCSITDAILDLPLLLFPTLYQTIIFRRKFIAV